MTDESRRVRVEDYERVSDNIIKYVHPVDSMCGVCGRDRRINFLKHFPGDPESTYYPVCNKCIQGDNPPLDIPNDKSMPGLSLTPPDTHPDTPLDTHPPTPPHREPDLGILHPSRIQILEVFRGRSLSQSEIRRESEVKPDNMIYHLKVLVKYGFVDKKKGEKRLVSGGLQSVNYYSLTGKGERGLAYFQNEQNK